MSYVQEPNIDMRGSKTVMQLRLLCHSKLRTRGQRIDVGFKEEDNNS